MRGQTLVLRSSQNELRLYDAQGFKFWAAGVARIHFVRLRRGRRCPGFAPVSPKWVVRVHLTPRGALIGAAPRLSGARVVRAYMEMGQGEDGLPLALAWEHA